MPRYVVPCVIEISGSIGVTANSPEEACELAQKLYHERRKEKGYEGFGADALDDFDVEHMIGECPEDVELDEDDNLEALRTALNEKGEV